VPRKGSFLEEKREKKRSIPTSEIIKQWGKVKGHGTVRER
jgi:hypothetical protein